MNSMTPALLASVVVAAAPCSCDEPVMVFVAAKAVLPILRNASPVIGLVGEECMTFAFGNVAGALLPDVLEGTDCIC